MEATGHTFDEWTVTKEPTETENGCQERKCEICGFTDTCELPLPATGGEIGGGEVPSGTPAAKEIDSTTSVSA